MRRIFQLDDTNIILLKNAIEILEIEIKTPNTAPGEVDIHTALQNVKDKFGQCFGKTYEFVD